MYGVVSYQQCIVPITNKANNSDYVLLLLLVLQSGQLRHRQEQRHSEHAEDDPQRTAGDVLPGQLLRVVVEELGVNNEENTNKVSQTARVVVAESIRHEELAAVQDDGVVLDRLHEGGDVASAESSNADGGET